jgi:hypothetical protein
MIGCAAGSVCEMKAQVSVRYCRTDDRVVFPAAEGTR